MSPAARGLWLGITAMALQLYMCPDVIREIRPALMKGAGAPALWVQRLASGFGLVFPDCNPNAVADLRSRIYALGLVHAQLMSSKNLETFDIAPFLTELAHNIVAGAGRDDGGAGTLRSALGCGSGSS